MATDRVMSFGPPVTRTGTEDQKAFKGIMTSKDRENEAGNPAGGIPVMIDFGEIPCYKATIV